MKPIEHLQKRFIAEQAKLLGWIETKNYWEYPLFAPDGSIIAYRQKKYPDAPIEGKKYLWKNGKPEDLDTQWYIAPDTKDEIEKAGGLAYLANGSPAMIAYRVAGIRNVLATELSEIAFPKDGVKYLKSIGISAVLYPVDKDEAGMQSAINWRDDLAGSGIDFIPLQWPDTMPAKADANDVLIYCKGNAEEFNWILRECTEEIELPISTVQKPIQFDYSSDKTPQGLIDTIASALGIHDWNNDGWSRKNVHCIFHDDSHESAGFNHISGVFHCFALCGSHSPKVVADRLGIDWKQYYPPKREKKAKKQSKSLERKGEIDLALSPDELMEMPEKPIYINTAWIDQDELPLTWLKALMLLTHSNSATVVYAIRFHQAIRAGLLDGKDMTITEIMAVLDSPRESTKAFIKFFLSLNYLWRLDTNLLEEDTDTNAINKSKKRGRPEIHYALNTHTDSLIITLAERLEPVLIERLSEDLGLAPRSHTMRDAFDLDLNEFKEWANRVNTPKHEYVLELVQNRISELLTNTSSITFTDYELEHPQNLRGKLMTMALMPYSERTIIDSTGNAVLVPRTGVQLSKAKIALELGCSESSLGKLYEENNIGRKRMYAWHEVKNPNFCDIKKEIREAPYNLDKEVGGVAYTAYMRYWSYGQLKKTELLYENDIFETFKKHNGKIEALFIRVEQPSLLWNMTSDEIEQKRLKAAKEAEKQADSADTDNEQETIQQMPEKAPEKKARKKSFVSNGDRLYTGHNPDFLREQIEKEVEDFSKYVLKGLALVDSSIGEISSSFQSLKEVIVWLNQNGEKSKGKKMKVKRIGVFYIRCELLDKTYVSSSEDIDKAVSKAYADLSNKKHSCLALQSAYNEFGKDSLQWGVLEECESSELADIETQWIAKISEEKEWAVFNRI